MNYIAEIRAFYDWLQFNQLPADAQALWHLLMHLNNKAAKKQGDLWIWPKSFTVSNSTITSILAFSRQQLDRMRNVLIQSGRIVYTKGKGSRSGTYHIIPLEANYVTQSGGANYVTQPVTQLDTQTGHKPGTSGDLCNIFGTYINNNSNSNSNPSIPLHSESDEMDRMDFDPDEVLESLKEQVDYQILIERYSQEDVDELLNIMLDAICDQSEYEEFGGRKLPRKIVQKRLLSLAFEHLAYVLDNRGRSRGIIKNVRAYLLAMLYNAPTTCSNEVTALFEFHERQGN